MESWKILKQWSYNTLLTKTGNEDELADDCLCLYLLFRHLTGFKNLPFLGSVSFYKNFNEEVLQNIWYWTFFNVFKLFFLSYNLNSSVCLCFFVYVKVLYYYCNNYNFAFIIFICKTVLTDSQGGLKGKRSVSDEQS